VTTVSHNQKLAELVRELDLSHLSKLPRDSGLAGWREWKYRSESLYSIYPGQETEGGSMNKPKTVHPPAHPLLLKYSSGGPDIPLGSLMHIVKSCPRLRYLLFLRCHLLQNHKFERFTYRCRLCHPPLCPSTTLETPPSVPPQTSNLPSNSLHRPALYL